MIQDFKCSVILNESPFRTFWSRTCLTGVVVRPTAFLMHVLHILQRKVFISLTLSPSLFRTEDWMETPRLFKPVLHLNRCSMHFEHGNFLYP